MRFAGMMVVGAAFIAPPPIAAEQAATPRPERQVVCLGRATGAQDEAVSVSIHVEPDGTRASAYTAWSPPQLNPPGKRGLDQPDLGFDLLYFDSSAGSIGTLSGSLVFVSVFSPLRKRESPAKLSARLDRLHASASFDGGQPMPFALGPLGSGIQDLPGTAMRSAKLALPSPTPRETAISLADRKGKPVLSQRYVTGSTTSRDALFGQAWQQADTATGNLLACELTAESGD